MLLDDGRSISRNVASLNTLIHDGINFSLINDSIISLKQPSGAVPENS